MPYDPTIPNAHGVSWFVSISPAASILWLGWSGIAYPRSHELQALQSDPKAQAAELMLWLEAKVIAKKYHLNPIYWQIELTLKWLDINPFLSP